MKVKIYSKINPVIILIIGLFFLSCSSDETEIPEEEIVAKVGERIITKDFFKSSYEFSLSPLRTSENPRETYLNYMINELLIANEGYSQGFDKNRYVTTRVRNRTNNILLESFYIKNVYNKVNIPEDEIVDVLKKSTIKFRLLIWPTPSLEKAAVAYDAANETSLEEFIDGEISKLEVRNLDRKNFETDWMDYLEIRPEIFNEIGTLEIGKPSKPIPYEGGYAIFQVMDLNREAIKSDELTAGARRKKIEARLFNIESDKIIHNIMDSILTPLEIRLSSEAVDLMVEPLFEWIKEGLPKRKTIVNNLKQVSDTSANYLKELQKLLRKELYSSVNGISYVEDYFDYMNYHRKYINQSKNPIELKNRLIKEIGDMIKNTKFIEIARNDGFLDSSNVKKDLQLWERKWTYDVFRNHLVRDITVSQEEMETFFKTRWRELRIANVDTTRFYKYEDDVFNYILFEKHSAKLNKELAALREKYPVWINEEVLNNIDLIESENAKTTSLFVVKNFSGEFLVPSVDKLWLNY